MYKATAIAHPIQGLIKYHGLKDDIRRIPFHDSISVCMGKFLTKTTVRLASDFENDVFFINTSPATGREYERAKDVMDEVRKITGRKERVLVYSQNLLEGKLFSFEEGKGLGWSSSGFSALALAGLATFEATDYLSDYKKISSIARLGAGSATRSAAGGFARWYASPDPKDPENSYATQIAGKQQFPNFRTIIYPIPKSVKTEDAHKEIVSSPFFEARLEYRKGVLPVMQEAIEKRYVNQIGRLAEVDSLNLAAATMTGETGMVNLIPESLKIYEKVRELRETEKDLLAYISWDTGPTTYINTVSKHVDRIIKEVGDIYVPIRYNGEVKVVQVKPVVSEVGDRVELTEDHLFN